MPSVTFKVKDQGSEGANALMGVKLIAAAIFMNDHPELELDPDQYEVLDDKNDHYVEED